MTDNQPLRRIDHCVLPVFDINTARARYSALGFTVAPDGKHPFGTENACVFFADGTFLEPIGVASREDCERNAIQGNVFLRNDQAFRFRRGEEGFSHLVFASNDAKQDHGAFRQKGISAGSMLRFTRKFQTPDGKRDKAAFRLAFASDPRAPDAHFFTCEVTHAPKIDRSGLIAHENGVTGIREIVLVEQNPTDFQYFLQELAGQREVNSHSFGMDIEAKNAVINVLTPAGLQGFYGLHDEHAERGLLLKAVALSVKNLASLRKLLQQNSVAFFEHSSRVVVIPEAGQGAALIFEE